MTKIKCHFSLVTTLTIASCLIQSVLGYSYMNCIDMSNVIHCVHCEFRCLHRGTKNISDFVDDLPITTTTLNISHNNITAEIPDYIFSHLPNLTYLNLDSNNISNFSEDALRNLFQLKNLNLSANNLNSLKPGLFQDLVGLNQLILYDNNLMTIPPDIFNGCSKLNYLTLRKNILQNFTAIALSVQNLKNLSKFDLGFNKLQSLEHSASLPPSLKELYLTANELHTLGCTSEFLEHVHVLDLSNNFKLSSVHFKGLNLSEISLLRLRRTNVTVPELLKLAPSLKPVHVDYSGLNLGNSSNVGIKSLCQLLTNSSTEMNRLILQSNNIISLQRDQFSCPKITGSLDLSMNGLKTVGCLEFLEGQRSLQNISVEHNHLSELKNCTTQSFYSVTFLSYRFNRILKVNADAFAHTPNLKTLQLNINIIAYLHPKALCNLTHLITLRLDNNLLTDLYNDSFIDLHNLTTLNLRNNHISVIFNDTFQSLKKLHIVDLGGNKIAQFQKRAFNGLESLENIYLDGNRITQIQLKIFAKLWPTLKILDLQHNYIEYLERKTTSPFAKLSNLTTLKLDNQQPYGIMFLPQNFFSGLTSLTALSLKYNGISGFGSNTSHDLTNLQWLTIDYSGVGVKPLPAGIFKHLKKLQSLAIENMGIDVISEQVFGNLTSLRKLNLNRNAMSTIDPAVLENLPHLNYVDLRDTPLVCTCNNSELQNWTKNNRRIQIVLLYSMTCPHQSHTSYFHQFDTKVCYLDIGLYFFVSTSIVVLLLTTLPLLYVKLYWKLKYSYYVIRSWFGEQWRRLRDEEKKCQYDAFISYNSADEEWVLKQLVPNLEGNGSSLRLCLHHRDFEPGRYIVDNIVSAVYGSRKTVCVVSRDFLRSEWCSLEIQLASHLLFDELRDVLVLVFLEHVSERQISAYHRMRKVMLKKTYLQWPGLNCTDPGQAQELFWTQLRRALRSSSSSSSSSTPQADKEGGEGGRDGAFTHKDSMACLSQTEDVRDIPV
ncbi:toll-like receptor 21 [Engraulis encrasicolus]|uniref:toll-like receptor 21 n=1 Tax=Engraulis encrasicolus TaxID=184585 RepID=UPI002FD58976